MPHSVSAPEGRLASANPSDPYLIPVLAVSGHLDRFLAEGWDLEWATDPGNISRVAVLRDMDTGAGAIYTSILRYHRKYGVAPTRAWVESEYPSADIPWDTGITPDEVTGAARDRLTGIRLSVYLGELRDYAIRNSGKQGITADDIPGLLELTEDFTREIQGHGPSALPFRILSLADIGNLPDPEFLIAGVIDHGTVTMLAGESGKGKSFVALDWALRVATGRPWLGRKTRRGRVLYVAAEGAYGMKKRLRAWQESYGSVPDGSFVLVPDAVQLSDSGHLQSLVRVARDFDFVIIDTLARTSSGLEENSARDMGVYVDALYKIRNAAKEAGNTTLVVHHTGYDTKRARGSSSLFANIDGQVMIESADPHAFMKLTVRKRKDGETGEEIGLRLVQVDTGGSTSCVVDGQESPGQAQTPRERVLSVLTLDPRTTKEVEAETLLPNSTVDRELKALVNAGLALPGKRGNANTYRTAE